MKGFNEISQPFRTIISPVKTDFEIDFDTPLLMLGSCFTDNIGERLEHDGFIVSHNPMGALYNPASILFVLNRISQSRYFDMGDIVPDDNDPVSYHCLAFQSRYQHNDAQRLLDMVNDDFEKLCSSFSAARYVIVTLGTSFIYKYLSEGNVVGNCHKLPAACFKRELMTVEQNRSCINTMARICNEAGKRMILTVSPIRHLSDGMALNSLSKSRLIDAVHTVCLKRAGYVEYFPAFEIMNDDLRDYRFYSADMTHPSEVAIDYIYSFFADTYFNDKTACQALENRKVYRQSLHRKIL